MNRRKSGEFSLTEKRVRSNGFEYVTFEVEGVLCGRRVRRQFKDRDQAFGEKNALEVQAANLGGEIRAQNTRLTPTQLAECEVAVARLGANRLSLAVDWFLTTYKAPMTEMSLENASKAFLDHSGARPKPHHARCGQDQQYAPGGHSAPVVIFDSSLGNVEE